MSATFERVIAEQQKEIDRQQNLIEAQNKTLSTMWAQHSELFEAIAKLLDASISGDENTIKRYHALRHEARMQMLGTGYCLRCYNFICECDYDD